MYPEADVPIVQVSLVRGLDPVLHQRVAEALTSLLEKHQNVSPQSNHTIKQQNVAQLSSPEHKVTVTQLTTT